MSIDFGTEFRTKLMTLQASDLPYTYGKGCPVSVKELVLLNFLFLDFEGLVKEGNMVVNERIVEPLSAVLKDAYIMEFPLHTAIPLYHPDFQGDDYASMEANNSSCFNHRPIAGTERLSEHSYGIAVDINPMMNPYLARDNNWYPRSGHAYIHRFDVSRGMLCADHPLVESFKEHGFSWGGEWERPDYHHFSFDG